jgi:hypothetical protein
MSVARSHNMGAYIKAVPIFGSSAVISHTSDGTPNAVEQTGRVIDRLAYGRRYYSAKVVIPFQASSTNVNTAAISITTRVQHATSTAAADFAALGSTGVVSTFGTTATSTSLVGCHIQDVNLSQARRYLRVLVTSNVAASSSGFMRFGGALLLGGADELLHSTADPATEVTS